ncbi:MAG TPA: hypothetical protein VFJ19_12555 [Nocardioidaceae bacterium]|nr:hypothetical protein [Nocardioidaceae bacterium]
MSPFSSPVLLGAAVVSSPALWDVVTGHGSLRVALVRYLVCVFACWVALEVMGVFVGPAETRDSDDREPGRGASDHSTADPEGASAKS